MKYLLLAEGFSADPHYGKTMRGVLRYRREDVVAILDSARAGESEDGVPVVATVEEALQFGPTTALVGVVTQGGYFPPAWMELLQACVEAGLGISAAAQVASLFDHVDLDGKLLLAHDPWPGVPFVDGVQLPPDAPGLGVHAQLNGQ